MAGVRLQKRPAEKRRAVFESGAQETPKRGENCLLASGILAVSLKEPLGFLSFWLRTGSLGLSRPSQRRPAEIVRLGWTNHWSWRKRAVSFCPKLARPASVEVRPPRPPNCRYCDHLPFRKSVLLLKMKTPRQLPRNTWSIEVSL